MATFPARFAGRCQACQERIYVDDPIRMTDDGAVHDDCTNAPRASEPVEHPVCPVCWLTHPAGACDR